MGAGSLFGIQILNFAPLGILARSPGGFFVFGVLMAAAVKLDIAKPSKLADGQACPGGCLGCSYACAPEEKVEGGNA